MPDYSRHFAQITADMEAAASLPFAEDARYMALYGAKISRMAGEYERYEIAYKRLLKHADDAAEKARRTN